ncbi:hypothetical protein GSI_09958 [Ganoderma sinense ZZ0214-1]|uniref:Uncharacterized protein n=1 Tax=Ganoderma sinense ZZ0214-1 TaxID=1077348 RepID=A0A2G8S2B9_9APHY|nr:hypothetical protein GSI_09958 [Ganoderma sinense ZZ0214-1]
MDGTVTSPFHISLFCIGEENPRASFKLPLIIEFLVLSFRQRRSEFVAMASSGSLNVATSLDIGRPQMHRAIPRLDLDVLQAICSSIAGVHDLLSVAQTCSLMWRIATREVLRTHTIHLTSSKAIRSFHMFILNHKATHAHHVRSLAISGSSTWYTGPPLCFDDAAADFLMDILDCTVKLDSLHLSLTSQSLRVDPARIAVVFAGLSSLTSLSLKDPGQRWAHYALDALPVQAPLRTLTVHAERKLVIQPVLEPGPYFRTFLRFSISSTLTSLRLDQAPIYDDSSFPHLPQFHSVRSLAITEPLERAPRLAALLHLFPSLDGTLYLRQSFRTGMQLFIDPSASDDAREQNRRAQDVFRWAGLDRLDCNAEIAGVLALQCPVRHLTIDRFDLKAVEAVRPKHLVVASLLLPFRAPGALADTSRSPLPDTSRRHLVVPFKGFFERKYAIPAPGPQRGHSIRESLLPSYTLQVELILTSSPSLMFVSPGSALYAQERLVQTILLFSSATHVRLVFYYDKKGPSEDKLERFMRDVRARASESGGAQLQFAPPPRLLAACPRLRYFFVTAAGGDSTTTNTPAAIPSERCWNHARAWRVVEPGEGGQSRVGGGSDEPAGAMPIVEELCDSAVRRIIEAEDLGLPEEWERKLEACRA